MPNIRPTVEDLGALMRARTKVRGGVELGYFRDEAGGDPPTRPTASEVEAAIDRILPTVSITLGNLPDSLADAGRTAVTYKVAQVLELGYWPEQNDTDQSVAAQWETLYTELVAALKLAVDQDDPGDVNVGFGSIVTLGLTGKRSTFTVTAGTTSGSPTVTTDTTDLAFGAMVLGAGIPVGTTILSVDSPTQLTLSADATATAPSAVLLIRF